MKKWERIAAAILALIGVYAALEALRIGFGTFATPGPGFFPFWLAVILTVISLLHFLGQLGSDLKPVSLWLKGTWIRPFLAMAIMFGYALLMGWLGFCSSTFLLFVAWMVIVEQESWLRVGLVSVLGTTCVYLLFAVFLKVPLPTGFLF